MQYDNIDQSQHCFDQAIVWTNVDWLSARFCGIHLRLISLEIWYVFDNYQFKITTTSPRDQWVNIFPIFCRYCNSMPGIHLTENISVKFKIRWKKFCPAVCRRLIQSQRNLAHNKTAQHSWNVQNFIVITVSPNRNKSVFYIYIIQYLIANIIVWLALNLFPTTTFYLSTCMHGSTFIGFHHGNHTLYCEKGDKPPVAVIRTDSNHILNGL